MSTNNSMKLHSYCDIKSLQITPTTPAPCLLKSRDPHYSSPKADGRERRQWRSSGLSWRHVGCVSKAGIKWSNFSRQKVTVTKIYMVKRWRTSKANVLSSTSTGAYLYKKAHISPETTSKTIATSGAVTGTNLFWRSIPFTLAK